MSTRPESKPATFRQLPLPLPEMSPPRPRLPSDGPLVPPSQVWTSLSPANQRQVRHLIGRLIQEMLNE